MSTQAVAWALDARQTGPISPDVRLVLVKLADHASPDGRGAYPSTVTLAEHLGITPRSVKRSLAQLRDAGLIGVGDQRLVEHIRGDRRPVVYDLALDGVQLVIKATGEVVDIGGEPYREERGDGSVTPSRRDTNVTPQPVDNPPRGDTRGRHGVTLSSPKPRTKPNTQTHLGLKGDPEARATARTSPIVTASLGPSTPPPARSLQAHEVSSRGTLIGTNCPGCGERVGDNHRCRKSALDESSAVHAASPFALAKLEERRQERAHPVDELPFEEHDPCLVCGTTSPQRPIIDDALGTCARCTAIHYRDQERAKRTTSPGEPA